MAVHPLVLKAIAMAATDKRTWKFLAVLIATLLTPVIFLVICIVMIFSSAEVTSGSVIEYCFANTALPQNMPEGEQTAIENMRLWLSELEEEMTEYEETDSLDETLVKAVFYCTHISYEPQNVADGEEIPIDYEAFVLCFEEKSITDLPEISESLSEQFPYIHLTANQSSAIQNAYTFIQELEVT